MAFAAERFLLLPIGAGAVPWDSATVTANQPLLGGGASDLLSARHDRGAYFYFGSHPRAQSEGSYDNSPTTEGTFVAGSGYSPADTITLSDGSTVTVDAVGGSGEVTQFTVDQSGSTGALAGATLTQSSVSPAGGTGFSLTLDVDNVTTARTFDFDLGATPPLINFAFLGGLVVSGTGLAPEDVSIAWQSDTDPAFGSPTAWGGSLAYVKRGSDTPAARLDMEQPNVGLADAELPAVMNRGELHSFVKSATWPAAPAAERYHRLTMDHTAAQNADQRLYVPMVYGGWAWQPDGAQWAPGALKRPTPVTRKDGTVLRRWSYSSQAILEDVYLLKLLEWFRANGNRNRAIFWQDPDLPQRFIQNCAMVQVLSLDATQNAGAFETAAVADAGQSETYELSFSLVERFNDEKER